jgi:CPA2 family monovalent cation:H+ antiporter-2
MIVEALATQAGKRPDIPDEEALAQVKQLMLGLGEVAPVRLDEGSAAVGKTLAQINLRGITGASVLAIARGDRGVIVAIAGEVLRAGDVLALAGTRDALSAATEVLKSPAAPGEPTAPSSQPADRSNHERTARGSGMRPP